MTPGLQMHMLQIATMRFTHFHTSFEDWIECLSLCVSWRAIFVLETNLMPKALARKELGKARCSAGPWGYPMPDLPPARSPLPFADFADFADVFFFCFICCTVPSVLQSVPDCLGTRPQNLQIVWLLPCLWPISGLFKTVSSLGHLSLTCASHISMPPPYILMLSAFEHL